MERIELLPLLCQVAQNRDVCCHLRFSPRSFPLCFMLHLRTNEGVKICSRYDRGLLRTTNQHYKASTMTVSTVIRDLLFADDRALASSNKDSPQNLCNTFHSAARKFGWNISIDETGAMYKAPPGSTYQAPNITVEGEPLKAVQTFKYLWSIVSNNNFMDAEIDARLAKANSAHNKLAKRLWRERGIRTGTKICIYFRFS